MDAITTTFSEINSFLLALKINSMYVILWIAAGYIQQKYFSATMLNVAVLKPFIKLNDAWKTMILGSIFSVIYAVLLRNVSTRATWVEFAASYIFATSLYELFLKDLANMILEKIRGVFKKRFDNAQ